MPSDTISHFDMIMINLNPQDNRGYWMLPQTPEEAGYYTYGTPRDGAAHYAHFKILNILFEVELKWANIDDRQFGVGNISLAGGGNFPPHRSHRSGLEVDVRPMRKDGRHQPVRYNNPQYDHEATKKLIALFWKTGLVKRIGFNDVNIPGVQSMAGHDDHFHVEAYP